MISTLISFLLVSSLVDSLSREYCTHCSSPLITLNARKFDVAFGRTSEGDADCIRNATKVWMPAICKGPCLTMNVTKEGESEPSGVLRDCLHKHALIEARIDETMEAEEMVSYSVACYNESANIKGTSYSVTYCACLGHLCNSGRTPLAARVEGDERRMGIAPTLSVSTTAAANEVIRENITPESTNPFTKGEDVWTTMEALGNALIEAESFPTAANAAIEDDMINRPKVNEYPFHDQLSITTTPSTDSAKNENSFPVVLGLIVIASIVFIVVFVVARRCRRRFSLFMDGLS